MLKLLGFIIDLPSWITSGEDTMTIIDNILIKGSELVTVTVPPALPTCLQIGISIAISRYVLFSIHAYKTVIDSRKLISIQYLLIKLTKLEELI